MPLIVQWMNGFRDRNSHCASEAEVETVPTSVYNENKSSFLTAHRVSSNLGKMLLHP